MSKKEYIYATGKRKSSIARVNIIPGTGKITINKKDIKNVFKKSFTGENGRNLSKSTGMGLYIAKRLCDKLGHKILIESEKNEYTIVKIILANNDYYKIDN